MSEFTEKWGAYGYVYDHEDASLVYFRNENYVPMGFTYDKYILLEAPLPETEEGVDAADALTEAGAAQDALRAGEPAPVTLMGLAEDSRSNMLMRAVALTGEQITKYGYPDLRSLRPGRSGPPRHGQHQLFRGRHRLYGRNHAGKGQSGVLLCAV